MPPTPTSHSAATPRTLSHSDAQSSSESAATPRTLSHSDAREPRLESPLDAMSTLDAAAAAADAAVCFGSPFSLASKSRQGDVSERAIGDGATGERSGATAVSYTHLTLPTICSV
eukprot:4257848-Prymnesium_polylepis.1